MEINCQPVTIIDVHKYSSANKLIRVTAWIMRFVNNLKREVEKRKGPLIYAELSEAEKYWIRICQTDLRSELESSKKGGRKINDSLSELRPFLDENKILRVGGRLQKSDLSFEEKHPVILHRKNKFSELKVIEAHERLFHAGVGHTLTQLREKYWIPKGRQLVRAALNKCLVCRRYNAQQGQQTVAPLPRDRISEASAFEITGVDFCGPAYVKTFSGSTKGYVALFTCAVTRAIHLELVTNLTTENFILAFRRFTSRRGICRIIYSDNAKTFKRANVELGSLSKTLSSNSKLNEYFGNVGITWKFIVERAAWWGGFWERLVRNVKICLRKKIGKALLTYEELETVLIEIEAVINSRPLTYTSNDVNDVSPLTPAHFFSGKRLTTIFSLAPKDDKPPTIRRQEINRRLRYRQRILDGFWSRWKREYLLQLRSAHYQKEPKQTTNLKIGDVVLVNDDRLPRHMWKMGRVTELHPGRDNKVRSAVLKLPSGKNIRRPVQLLYPLELD